MNFYRTHLKIWQTGLIIWAVFSVFSTFGCNGNRFIFSASKDMVSTPADAGLIYEEVWFNTRDGVEIHGWLVPGDPEKPLILFFHGNAANISYRVDNLKFFNDIGFPVFIFDYRGYGKSKGQATREEDLYVDARSAFDYLCDRGWSSSQMIYYGRSMGAAVCLQLGIEIPPAGVVLECPFTSMAEIAWHTAPVMYALFGWWAIDARFDNINKIEKLSTPVAIFQGDADHIVPVEMAQQLFQRANDPKAFYLIPGGGHSDLFQVGGDQYRNAWVELIRLWASSEKV